MSPSHVLSTPILLKSSKVSEDIKLDSNTPIKLAVMYLAVILFPSNLIVDKLIICNIFAIS